MKNVPSQINHPNGANPDRASETAHAASAPDPLHNPDPLETSLSPAANRIDLAEWSRVIPPIMARIPEVRFGKRWVSILWALPIGFAGLIIGIAVAQQLRTIQRCSNSSSAIPGRGASSHPSHWGFPYGCASCTS
jgi:sulfoxide reductase catalytic subunit YedY